jgi:hypothetical protein
MTACDSRVKSSMIFQYPEFASTYQRIAHKIHTVTLVRQYLFLQRFFDTRRQPPFALPSPAQHRLQIHPSTRLRPPWAPVLHRPVRGSRQFVSLNLCFFRSDSLNLTLSSLIANCSKNTEGYSGFELIRPDGQIELPCCLLFVTP